MRRGLFSDTQPEIGQNIAGRVNQIAVFVLIYFVQPQTAAGYEINLQDKPVNGLTSEIYLRFT